MLGRLAHLRYVHSVDGAFRFDHALVRDVAYARLPISTRARLHARYAREGLDPDQVEALAHHWWEALGANDAEWIWEGEPEIEVMRGEALRADDNPEALHKRLEAYRIQTAPLIAFYAGKGTLRTVDGMVPIADVAKAIDLVLAEAEQSNHRRRAERRSTGG